MLKRVISLVLSVCVLAVCCAVFSGCSNDKNKDYPVTLGNVTISKEPKNIVVLSDCLADIISYIGYDVKMVGKSIDCDQAFLSVVPSVGLKGDPDVTKIIESETDLIITDSPLSDSAQQQLEKKNIPIVTMLKANSMDELKTLYSNLGMILGGNVTGKTKGEEAYTKLIDTLKSFDSSISKSIVKTAAYLYINDEGKLCSFTNGSIEQELFGYCSAINVFANQETPEVDIEKLKMSTPTYIFYDSDEVIDYLKADKNLSTLSALSSDHTMKVELTNFYRQGVTYEDTVYNIMSFMFIEPEATPDEATVNIQDEINATAKETQNETNTLEPASEN